MRALAHRLLLAWIVVGWLIFVPLALLLLGCPTC